MMISILAQMLVLRFQPQFRIIFLFLVSVLGSDFLEVSYISVDAKPGWRAVTTTLCGR